MNTRRGVAKNGHSLFAARSAAIAAALLLASCTTITAQLERPFVIAPEPYLSQGQGMLDRGEIEIRSVEPASLGCVSGMACASLYVGGRCVISIRSDFSPDYARRVIRDHEAAHCAGWGADHRGGGA